MTKSVRTMPSWSRNVVICMMLLVGACSSSKVASVGAAPPPARATIPTLAQPEPLELPAETMVGSAGPTETRPPILGGGAAPIAPRSARYLASAPAIAMPPPLPAVEKPFCEIIGDTATVEECARLSAYRANLKTGSAAFNAPARMLRGETVMLRLVIDKAANSAAPTAAVDALPGDTTGFATKVGRYMRAELSGNGFKIVPRDADPSRDLFAATQAQWEWDVTALTGGDHVLTLKTYVEVIDSAGKKQPMGEIVTENRAVHVEVDTAGKSSDLIDDSIVWFGKGTNLFKALATLLGAALAAWLAFRKFGGGAKT